MREVSEISSSFPASLFTCLSSQGKSRWNQKPLHKPRDACLGSGWTMGRPPTLAAALGSLGEGGGPGPWASKPALARRGPWTCI